MSRYVDNDSNTPIAYAVIAKDDDGDHEDDTRRMMAVEMHAPNTTQVSAEFRHIPEARDLTWFDTYFEDDHDSDDVVAVFDLDYEKMENYYTGIGWVVYSSTLCCPHFFWTGVMLGVPCYLGPNVQWNVRSQHVAITRDGIKIIRERRPTCWGWPCTDAGKSSRTIPFDQITDCDIVEPAGSTCLCILNTLYQVHIDTASSNPAGQNNGQHELTIAGLRNPQAFKKLVWAMKRANASLSAPRGSDVVDRGLAVALAAAERGGNDHNSSSSSDDVATLLRDIRDELRQHNEALRGMRPNNDDNNITDANTVV